MKGYSKIKIKETQKSRSMDFSGVSISYPDQTLEPTKNSSEAQESNQISNVSKNMSNKQKFCLPDQQVDQDEGGNLSRSCSVSSNSGFHDSVVKRALSMRRSSSVSGRYCRIHDQSMTDNDDEEGGKRVRASRRSSMDPKKQRGGKILKACKRLFGL